MEDEVVAILHLGDEPSMLTAGLLALLIGEEGGEGGQPLLTARGQVAGRKRVSQFLQTGSRCRTAGRRCCSVENRGLCSHPDGQPVGWIQAYPRGEGEVGTHAHEPPAPVRILQIRLYWFTHRCWYSRWGLGLSLSPIANRMRAGSPAFRMATTWLGWASGSRALSTCFPGSRPRHLLEAPESEHPIGRSGSSPSIETDRRFPSGSAW